ncbi:MAG: hypothetical protein HUK24_00700, partial [Sphaerochaetaceae bacterium]|nr:hypothetical protein [Sphaerochaetaceae bacterium]
KTLGLAEGKAESAREIALKFLSIGNVSLSDISFATGLSLDELDKLKRTL